MNARGAPTRVLQSGEEGGGAGRGAQRPRAKRCPAFDMSPPVCADADDGGNGDYDDDGDDLGNELTTGAHSCWLLTDLVGQVRSHR